MSRLNINHMEAGVQTRKMPQDNPEVWQGIRDLIDDPVTYLARERAASLQEARQLVDQRVTQKLAEQREAQAQRLGQRLLRLLHRL